MEWNMQFHADGWVASGGLATLCKAFACCMLILGLNVQGMSSHRPVAGIFAGGQSLCTKPPFMGTEQFEARQKEMVKTIMAGIHRYLILS